MKVTKIEEEPFTYSPVDEDWQRRICATFGWPFENASKPSTVQEECDVDKHRQPNRHTSIVGDGNCWYRTVAYIATGSEKNYRAVKKSILQYMKHNAEMLQQHYETRLYAIEEICNNANLKLPLSNTLPKDFIQDLIKKHEDQNKNVWADNVIMELTAAMLKTPYYLYFGETIKTDARWISLEKSMAADIWNNRDKLKDVPAHTVKPTMKGAMFILYINREHFEPAHNGLQRIRKSKIIHDV